MIAITDGYYIDVSGDGCYTVMKFTGTTADKETGMEKPVYRPQGYFGSLENALRHCLKLIKAERLRDGCVELEKALKIIRQENKKFSDLLKKCMKEIGEYE